MSSPGVIRWPSRPHGAAGVFVHGKFSGEECKLQEGRDLLCDQREQNGGEVRGMEPSWWCSGVAPAHGSPRESFSVVEQIIAKHQLTVLSKGKRDPRYGSTRGKGDGQVWRVLRGEPGAQGWAGGFCCIRLLFLNASYHNCLPSWIANTTHVRGDTGQLLGRAMRGGDGVARALQERSWSVWPEGSNAGRYIMSSRH